MPTAPIGPLTWELPCAMGAALERTGEKKKKEIHVRAEIEFQLRVKLRRTDGLEGIFWTRGH